MRTIDIGFEDTAYQIVIWHKDKIYTLDPNAGRRSPRKIDQERPEQYVHVTHLDYNRRKIFKTLNRRMDLGIDVHGACCAYAQFDQEQSPQVVSACSFRTLHNHRLIILYFFSDNFEEIFDRVWARFNLSVYSLKFGLILHPNTKEDILKAIREAAVLDQTHVERVISDSEIPV